MNLDILVGKTVTLYVFENSAYTEEELERQRETLTTLVIELIILFWITLMILSIRKNRSK